MFQFPEAFAGSLVGVAFFACIALTVWFDARRKMHERQLAHAERLKALELGQPLPDAEVARAEAQGSSAWAAALVGILVPLFMAITAAAITLTALVRKEPGEALSITPFAVGWGIAGVISLVAVVRSLRAIRLRRQPADQSALSRSPRPAGEAVAIREKPSSE